MAEVICNVFSIISLTAYCASNFFKTKKKILGVQLIVGVSDFIMYTISGALAGIASAVAGTLRNIAFVKFNSKKAVMLFAALKVVLLIIGYEGVASLLFIILETLSCIAILYGTAQQLRYVLTSRQVVWVVYNYTMVTWVVALTSVVKLIFCVLSVLVHWKDDLTVGDNKDGSACE